jgi:hypothetical protein
MKQQWHLKTVTEKESKKETHNGTDGGERERERAHSHMHIRVIEVAQKSKSTVRKGKPI